MLAPRIRGVGHSPTRRRARERRSSASAPPLAPGTPIGELDGAEAVRVGLAQALVLEPALLVIDEPVTGVDLLEHERHPRAAALARRRRDRGPDERQRVDRVHQTPTASCSIRGGGLGGSVDPELPSVHQLLREASA